ncbi:MAG: hypothetical protein HC869_26685 [Rhodospirillales bacterium]|nr:hypothetical protein [Rhodospirillales bacterium]
MDLLCSGRLPPEQSNQWPGDVGNWDRIEGNRFVKRGTHPQFSPTSSQAGLGLIVHYDIVHAHRARMATYADDPIFDLVRATAALSVVNLRPSPAQLMVQFTSREEEIYARKGRVRGAWRSMMLGSARRLLLRLKGEAALGKHALYTDAVWLEECYARWDRFMETLPAERVTYLEPASDAAGLPSFRPRQRM